MNFDNKPYHVESDVCSGKCNISFCESIKRRRSMDANDYAHKLISRIADVLQAKKEEVYIQMIQQYGQPQLDEVGQPIFIAALSKVDVSKYGIYAKKAGCKTFNGEEYITYMIMRGISTYTTKEMRIFIDGIVSDAKELGIDILPRLLWGN